MNPTLAVLIACAVISAGQANAVSHDKVTLTFSLDQGFGNGVVVHDDLVAVKRIVNALRPLEESYRVCILLNPHVADRKKLDHILDTLKAEKMPFVFDVYSSDCLALGSTTVQNKPYDPRHGLAISIDDLAKYKKRYGRWLAGIRFMEVFAEDFTVRAVKTTNPEWLPSGCKLPEDAFFQPAIAEQFLEFAEKHGMFVQWSDWHWFEFAGWDGPLKDKEAAFSDLLRKFPNLVTVTYANNEPNEDSVQRLGCWETAVQKFVKDGAAGFGLSDQSWLRRDHFNCPADDVIAWASSALDKGCRYIQFEPVWYLFKLPIGTFEVQAYTKDAKWADRGEPTENFKRCAEALMRSSRKQAKQKETLEERKNNGKRS